MELREYLRVLAKNWWLILLLTLVGLSGALLFSYSRQPIYEATSTYVVSLAPFDSIGNTIYGMGLLTSSQQRMFATYCQVMSSGAVRSEAGKLIGVDTDSLDPNTYTVSCTVLPDTNVLRLITHGTAPALTRRLNEAIGVLGMARAKSLYTYFPLERLDAVNVDDTPILPNHIEDALLGTMLGVVLGISAAMVKEYLRSPSERLEATSIRNPRFGVYNERYFQQRLLEEINRARVRNRPISVALMRLVPDEDFVLIPEKVQQALLRKAALRLQDTLRQENIIAYMGNHLFAILLPETPGDEAQAILESLHADIRNHTFRADDYVASFVARTGLVESSGGALSLESMLKKAQEALEKTSPIDAEDSIQLLRASPRPFVLGASSPGEATVEAALAEHSNGHSPHQTTQTEDSQIPADGERNV